MRRDERPDLTALPAFNQLLKDCDRHFAGELDLADVQATMHEVDDQLGRLYAHFHESVMFQESTPLLEEASGLIYEGFGKIRLLWPELRAFLEEGNATRARRVLDRVRQRINVIFEQFGRLREEEEARPQYSESPPVNELLRVGHAFMAGKLPLERFRQRLDQFIEMHQGLVGGLEMLAPAAAEQRVLAERTQAMREAVDKQADAIQALDQFFEEQNPAMLKPAFAGLQAAARELLEIQRELTRAVEGPTSKSCLRCSHPNPPGARYCEQCNAQFPSVDHLEDSGPQLNLMEDVPGQAGLPENLQILRETIDRVKSGALPKDELSKTLDWLQGQIDSARKRLEALPPPPPETPDDQMSVYERARAALVAGAEQMEVGLTTLRSWFERADPSRLDYGFEQVLAGADQMLEVEELWRDVSARHRIS